MSANLPVSSSNAIVSATTPFPNDALIGFAFAPLANLIAVLVLN
jgi:hypothetical protein